MKNKSYYKRPMFFGWYSIDYNQGIHHRGRTAERNSQSPLSILKS